jgi:hypothetical protein
VQIQSDDLLRKQALELANQNRRMQLLFRPLPHHYEMGGAAYGA